MIRTTMTLIFCILCVPCTAWPADATDPPKRLGDVCPRLHIPGRDDHEGADPEPIVIDDAMVRLYAERGRFAAIGPTAPSDSTTPATEASVDKNPSPSKTRDRWRAEYRREVAALRKLALRLAIARDELGDLEDQYYRAGSEKKRLRMEPRINRKKLQIKDLEYSLEKQRSSFSHLVRQARRDGAQPGWFRDLPRP